MPVVKDLVPDLTNFYAQYAAVKPWLQTRTPAPPDRERPAVEGRPGKDRSSLGLHPVRLLFHGLSQLLVEQRPLSRARGAARGLSLDHRFARRSHRRKARRARRSFPPVSLPHHHELHRGVPEGPQSGQGHRRDQEDDARAPALDACECLQNSWTAPLRRRFPIVARERLGNAAMALPARHEGTRFPAAAIPAERYARRGKRRTRGFRGLSRIARPGHRTLSAGGRCPTPIPATPPCAAYCSSN